jgi:hypothetical protein
MGCDGMGILRLRTGQNTLDSSRTRRDIQVLSDLSRKPSLQTSVVRADVDTERPSERVSQGICKLLPICAAKTHSPSQPY